MAEVVAFTKSAAVRLKSFRMAGAVGPFEFSDVGERAADGLEAALSTTHLSSKPTFRAHDVIK
jgi:hypothetical protein